MSPPYPPTGRRSVRGWRLPLLALLLTVAALVPVAAPAATGEGLVAPSPTTVPGPPRVPALWMPVTGSVVWGFDARAGPYGPGHRGIDIAAPWERPCGHRPPGGSCSPVPWPGQSGSASWSPRASG